MSTQHEDDRDVPAPNGGGDGDGPRDGGDASGATEVAAEDWRETERWLDEWTRRSDQVGAPAADGAAADPTTGPADADASAPDDPAPADRERVAADGWPVGYVPPPSPAYAPGGPPSPQFTRANPSPRPAPPAAEPAPLVLPDPPPSLDPGLRDAPISRGRQRVGQLLFASLAVAVAVLASVTLLTLDGDDGLRTVTLGRVGAVEPGATVRTGAASRPLEVGDEILAGDVVQAPPDGKVTVELEGDGVVRFDTGASVTFTDEALDAETGERQGDSEPSLQVLAGRAWINPPDGTTVEVQIPGGRATSVANPIALECPGDCTLHAPAAGIDIDSDGGGDAAPTPTELVTLGSDGSMTLAVDAAETAWARENLDADRGAGLPEPEAGDEAGVVASAVFDGTYALRIDVTGAPAGDPLPDALLYGVGESYSLDLRADGSACPPTSCELPVTAADGATGTADVGDGTLAVVFTQPINCYDESRDNVVVASIGTTTVTATMLVGEVVQDGPRWRIVTTSGSGTVSTTLTTPCNPGDVLGTSSSTTTVAIG